MSPTTSICPSISETPNLFADYADIIREMRLPLNESDSEIDPRLIMASDGPLTISYAPFDHVNATARLVLVGITPGRQQMFNALREAQRQLRLGTDMETASMAAKNTASFSGPMRANLVAMLDYFRINELLGIASCASLFGLDRGLVHYTSALRYPVFVAGANYAGQPSMLRVAPLRELLTRHLSAEVRLLKDAYFVPLGAKVTEALEFLAQRGEIDRDRILDGLQHPSGANAERIAYLLGRKPQSMLSAKTPPQPIDAARERLRSKVKELLARPVST